MIMIDLCIAGEYGRRLIRYLERHMDKTIRLRHFTQPDQWTADADMGELIIMSRSFFRELSAEGKVSLPDYNVLWITDEEGGEGYCRFHPPEELKEMALHRLGPADYQAGYHDFSVYRFNAVFSPAFDLELYALIQSYMQAGDLYLGMEDMGGVYPHSAERGRSESRYLIDTEKEYLSEDSLSGAGKGHMGDLCYYIHLRDSEILFRIKELSVQADGYKLLPAPAVFLPLLELTEDDYLWFFQQLKNESRYTRIYVGLGCGMLFAKKLLSHMDRLILLSSREDKHRYNCCELIKQSLQAGYASFSGNCEVVFREDVIRDAGAASD